LVAEANPWPGSERATPAMSDDNLLPFSFPAVQRKKITVMCLTQPARLAPFRSALAAGSLPESPMSPRSIPYANYYLSWDAKTKGQDESEMFLVALPPRKLRSDIPDVGPVLGQ